LDQAEILTVDHIVLEFERSDLESELYSESSVYRKIIVVGLLTTLTFLACLVHNFFYSYSIKLIIVAFDS